MDWERERDRYTMRDFAEDIASGIVLAALWGLLIAAWIFWGN